MARNVRVSSTIRINTRALDMLDNAQLEALAMTGDATLTELRDRQVMPFDTGNMQNDSTFLDDSQKGKVSIVTTAPQARRLYFHPEYNFKRGNNHSAGGKWFESFLNDDFVKKTYAQLLRQRGGL